MYIYIHIHTTYTTYIKKCLASIVEELQVGVIVDAVVPHGRLHCASFHFRRNTKKQTTNKTVTHDCLLPLVTIESGVALVDGSHRLSWLGHLETNSCVHHTASGPSNTELPYTRPLVSTKRWALKKKQ